MATGGSGGTAFPAVDVDKELNPGKLKTFEADAVSSEITTSKEIKEQLEKAKQQHKENEKQDTVQKLKSAIIISGIIAAVAGAVFAISKKLREK